MSDPSVPGAGRVAIRILTGVGLVIGIISVMRLGLVVAATPPGAWLDIYPRLINLSLPSDASRQALAELVGEAIRDPAMIRARLADCQPPEQPAVDAERAQRDERCIAVIDAALRFSPSSGELWFFKADRLMRSARLDAAIVALRQSYLMARREGWIASARVVLGLRLYPLLPVDLQKATVGDLRLVLEFPEFLPPLIEAYGRDASLRTAGAAAIHELPPVLFDEFVKTFPANRVLGGVARSASRLNIAESRTSANLPYY